ncbi:hypothetical protein E4K72_03220 [Oxalobacteraceae bacterium OM1]|nr:hypothetical protein E4K72_03220 [Oxalobacteraceae bacterium OM1]
MKLFKKTLLAAALSTAAAGAFAMTPMQDENLAQVSGQDGVSIGANLNVNIGEFKYTDTDAAGGSISFYNIKTTGLIAATLDVINSTTYNAILAGVGVNLGAMYNGVSDVVQIAIPADITVADKRVLLSQSIAAVKMGGNYSTAAGADLVQAANNLNPSFGSFAMNQIDLRGTTAWIWAH